MNYKYNIVVPMAGQGSRMVAGGYKLPKPMLVCGDKSIIEWGMLSIDVSEANLVFVVRHEHINNFAIDEYLYSLYPDCKISWISGNTGGATDTVMCVESVMIPDKPLIIYTPDTTFEPKYTPKDTDFDNDGLILTFKANSPNYSYCKTNGEGNVIITAEKQVISDAASVGVYGFKSWDLFHKYAKPYTEQCYQNKKESHIAPLYNYLIDAGGIVKTKGVSKIHIMGTPEEFKFCENVSFKYLRNRKFVLASDHSGFKLKERIKFILGKKGVSFIDMGCYSDRDCDYNPYVESACDYVKKEKDYFGIGICRTGQGVNICANKQNGIRSGLISDQYTASMAIRHNAANFFSLSEMAFLAQDDYLLECVLQVLITETFDGGRHQCRLINYVNN